MSLQRLKAGLLVCRSALELMDPKMDCGMRPESIPSVTQLSATVPFDLSARQIVRVMDELMCAETTFYTGQSIAHTIFTCVYAHR
jgi:hypothetical protein